MSVLNTVKGKARELGEAAGAKANEIADSEKVSSAKSALANGLAGAGRFVDEKTGGKYASQIHTGVGKAKDLLGHGEKPAEQAEHAPPEEDSAQPQKPGHVDDGPDAPQQQS